MPTRAHFLPVLLAPALALALVGFLPLAGCGAAQEAVVVSPSTHDFGRVLKGERPDFVFTLTNNSNRIVQFSAQANCACFAVAQGLAPLDPGRSLEFRVLFDTTALPPEKVQGKFISIHTDHPDVGSIVVPLHGEIYSAYTLIPENISLGRIDGKPNDYEPRVVNIRPLEDHQIRLTGSFQMPPVFDITSSAAASGGLDVAIALKQDVRRPVGPFSAKIRLDLEVTDGQGKTRKEERIVQLDGFWIVPP